MEKEIGEDRKKKRIFRKEKRKQLIASIKMAHVKQKSNAWNKKHCH